MFDLSLGKAQTDIDTNRMNEFVTNTSKNKQCFLLSDLMETAAISLLPLHSVNMWRADVKPEIQQAWFETTNTKLPLNLSTSNYKITALLVV